MTKLSSNAGAARTAGCAAPFSGARRAGPMLLAGVSLLTLLASGPASAAAYTAANQAELYAKIIEAQGSADPASTITLTGSFALNSAPPAIAGKNITIATGGNTLSYTFPLVFDVGAGATLTVTGNLQTAGSINQRVFTKQGAGDLIFNGATVSGISIINLPTGNTLINGGSQVSYGINSTSTQQLVVAGGNNQVANLTLSGAGTKLTTTGAGTGANAFSGGNGSVSTLTIEQGAVFSSNVTLQLHDLASKGTATVNVKDSGSRLEARVFSSFNGTSYVNVTNGGVIAISTSANLGGLSNTAYSDANVTALVSGDGSQWNTAASMNMYAGRLSVLDGGVVTAATANIASSNTALATQFEVLVSGEGSEFRANTMNVGTRHTGTLTIANDGKVVVGGGAAALTLGGAFGTSNATLNIGGAVGFAAEAAGTLEASGINLADSADINFNHTETGYAFDLPITGKGTINQLAGRTIFTADQLGFTGLTMVGGGTLEVNGRLGGTVNVIGGALAGNGFVGDTTLAAGGNIAPGSNGIGTLTIAGNYTGAGGVLQIETVLSDDGSSTDVLKITGNSTGNSNLKVINLGGTGGQTSDGIRIIDVDGTSTGTFSLLGDTVYEGQQAVIGGAYLYGLHQGTVDVADGDWYLRSILDPDQNPVFQPAAPVIETYAAAALQAFNTSESLQQRTGNRSWSGSEGNGIWGRIEARHTSLGPDDSTTSASYEVDTWRLQAGADGVLSEDAAGSLVVGLNTQIGTISAAIGSASGNGGIEGAAFGLGGTLTWYGKSGFYLDLQGKLNWFDSTLSADLLSGPLVSGNAGFGYALSLEAGQQLALGDGWSITPQAQLSYSSVDFENFDSYGSTVALLSGDSLNGRLGVSADYEGEWQDTAAETGRTHLYGIANLSYEFLDGTATSVGGTTLVNQADPLWGSVGLGGSLNWAGDQLSLYGEANVGTSLNHLGDSYSLGVTAGIRGKL